MQKIILLFSFLLTLQFSFAQKKTYADSLSKAFNKVFATLPEKCPDLYGTPYQDLKNSYNSTVILPRSTDNRFDVDGYMGTYPIVLMSYVPLGNDKNKAIVELKKIDKAIKAMTITYKGKKYKIQLLTKESKFGDKPDYQYKLIDPPAELADAKIYARLDDNFGVKTKFKATMGIYIKLEEK